MQIPDERGRLLSAPDALGEADRAVAEGEQDIPKAVMAAINCFSRRGGG